MKKRKRIGILAAMDKNQTHFVRIPWRNQKNAWWTESCAMVVEVFGLPGERYTSHPSMDYMDFRFKSSKDAQVCKILLSDRV